MLQQLPQKQIEIHETSIDTATDQSGDDNSHCHKIITSQTGEGLMRHELTSELYMSLSSTKVPKQKKEMLYVPREFKNDLIIDA